MNTADSKLRDQIKDLLNNAKVKYCQNTPTYILAEYLEGCLVALDRVMVARDRHQSADRQPERPLDTEQTEHRCCYCNFAATKLDREVFTNDHGGKAHVCLNATCQLIADDDDDFYGITPGELKRRKYSSR